jgi:hypothetical protein
MKPHPAAQLPSALDKPLGLKRAQNLGDLKQLLKPLQHLLQ